MNKQYVTLYLSIASEQVLCLNTVKLLFLTAEAAEPSMCTQRFWFKLIKADNCCLLGGEHPGKNSYACPVYKDYLFFLEVCVTCPKFATS